MSAAPNEWGVYSRADAERLEMPGSKALREASIYLLEARPGLWLWSVDVTAPGGGFTGPLTERDSQPSRALALAAAANLLLARGGQMECSPYGNARAFGRKLGKWAQGLLKEAGG